MSTADRIGLLPGFGWLFADHGFGMTLAICWVVSPLGVWIMQLAVDRQPIVWSQNYLSFFPGDLFLGMLAAAALTMARSLPAAPRWYNGLTFHVALLCVTLMGACLLTWLDYHTKKYTKAEIFTGAKLYHDLGLYGLYAYVILSTLTALIASGTWSKSTGLLSVAIIGFTVWFILVLIDSTLTGSSKSASAQQPELSTVADTGTNSTNT